MVDPTGCRLTPTATRQNTIVLGTTFDKVKKIQVRTKLAVRCVGSEKSIRTLERRAEIDLLSLNQGLFI
jgi:hypothetical protein